MTKKVITISYDYTYALLMLALLGVVALFIGIWLKALDKKKGYKKVNMP